MLLLLDKGASVEAKDKWGYTPLSWAARAGQHAVVDLLLDRGADTKSKDNMGRTPLAWATEARCEGREKTVGLLLQPHGAKSRQTGGLGAAPY